MRIHVDIVSDVVCPWCYIGKRRFEAALKGMPDVEATITWRPFQLAPELPPEGMDRKTYLRERFGDEAKIKGMGDTITQHGKALGIDFRFDAIERAPNTLDAHRLIGWAETAGVQDAVVEALFHAYFTEGKDVSDAAVLSEIAGNCGMDAALVAKLLASDADAEAVRNDITEAANMGIPGVPAFVFARKYMVTGAQEVELFQQVMRRIEEIESGENLA